MEICEWCNGPLDPKWNEENPYHLECLIEQTGVLGKHVKKRIQRLEDALRGLIENAVPIYQQRNDGVKVKTGRSEIPNTLIEIAKQALKGGRNR